MFKIKNYPKFPVPMIFSFEIPFKRKSFPNAFSNNSTPLKETDSLRGLRYGNTKRKRKKKAEVSEEKRIVAN